MVGSVEDVGRRRVDRDGTGAGGRVRGLLAGMDGESFIRRACRLCPTTAYLLHTGMDYPLSDELRAIGMTPADVLQKPIHELSTLTRRIVAVATAGGRIG